MNTFDLFELPLKGAHLIESGAGTGKTYTLAAIFLRLVIEQGIAVEKILVVTYTRAATEELKTRIRRRLVTAKKNWPMDNPDDPLVEELRSRNITSEAALQRIQDALINFDRAAIYTIHGFCQRILQTYAFETGHDFRFELVQDDTEFLHEAAEDFWRRYLTCAPKELVVETGKQLKSPDQLAKMLQRCRFPRIAIWPDGKKPKLAAILPWRGVAGSVHRQWPRVRDQVMALLQYDGLNAHMYGACKNRNGGSDPSPRQVKMSALALAMDQWSGDYPLFEKFELFTSEKITLATKKGKQVPEHPFFNLCQQAAEQQRQLKAQLESYLGYLRARFVEKARSAASQNKSRHNVLFFDDLLLLVHRAVMDRRGNRLGDAIRSQYRAALVDEFQDTDQLQYEIFFKLFANDQNLLAMIGDPKQAIYSFRGADLFSYLQAARAAKTCSTLTKNWRATPELIDALNTLFADHPKPFGFSQVGFQKAMAGHSAPSKFSPALRMWYLPGMAEGAPRGKLNSSDAENQIARAVAHEIVGLLANPDYEILPEQIAILVRSHRQAHIVKQALSLKKIPAVLHSAGRIFDTPEAEDLEHVMAAVAMPTDLDRVRAALAGPLFLCEAAFFSNRLNDPNLPWPSQLEQFRVYNRVWLQQGFFAMFRFMLSREGIKKQILSHPGGERALTNLLHLGELLHQAEMAYGLSPDGLIKWLVSKRFSGELGSDDQQLRLESDARAVRIITMHKSKGLQFEVVLCPYTWAGIRDDQEAAVLHDPAKGHRLTLGLGPMIPAAMKQQARKEMLAENLRMLYVALTRARQCCYWVWGRIKGAAVSAPAYLLHGHNIDMETEDWDLRLKAEMAELDHGRWVQLLTRLEHRSGGSIGVAPLPESGRTDHQPLDEPDGPLSARTAAWGFENNWRIASFSGITAHGVDRVDGQDRMDDRCKDDTTQPEPSPEDRSLFAFPRGPRAGLFFHDLLEHWDHTEADADLLKTLVIQKLQQHGYEPEWEKSVGQMLHTLAWTPLTAAKEGFALQQVAPEARINEMAFYFPLNAVGPDQFQKVFQRYAGQAIHGKMANAMGRIHFSPIQGFMKGYIDMVFSHGSRYYLLDWKSNHLGSRYEDYGPAQLDEAMTASYYFLQYHLYAVALDQWLRRRLENYQYSRHFGGVFYIFLRGLDPNGKSSRGIYFDRPAPQLMEALNRMLIASS